MIRRLVFLQAGVTIVAAILLVLLVATGFASITLVPCWAVFGRGQLAWRLFAFAIVFLLISSVLSWTAYWQTSSATAAITWALWSTTEVAFATLSLCWLRRLGYRITRPGTPSRPGI